MSAGYHALEILQSQVELRVGGETGVTSVRCLAGHDQVWGWLDSVRLNGVLRAPLVRLSVRRVDRTCLSGLSVLDACAVAWSAQAAGQWTAPLLKAALVVLESGGGVPAGTAGVVDRAAVDFPHLFEVEYGAQSSHTVNHTTHSEPSTILRFLLIGNNRSKIGVNSL